MTPVWGDVLAGPVLAVPDENDEPSGVPAWNGRRP